MAARSNRRVIDVLPTRGIIGLERFILLIGVANPSKIALIEVTESLEILF